MRKIKWPKIGQYVMVTKYSDKDPQDPWYIGFICEITYNKNEVLYKVNGSNRIWKNCFKITKEEGDDWLSLYHMYASRDGM